MDESIVINPPRRAGYIFHFLAISILASLSGFFLFQAVQSVLGPIFLMYLLGGLFLAVPIPLLFYRVYALYRSAYVLGRDGLKIKWGLREEHIPMTDIDWVRMAATLDHSLQMPRIRWPGGFVGTRQNKELGKVEFMAARANEAILIGSKKRVFVISPIDHKQFIKNFRYQIELGGLKPLEPRSVYPSFLLAEIWKSKLARVLALSGFILNIALLVWVSLEVPNMDTISLGFTPTQTLLSPVPGVQLFLLPFISGMFYLTNFVAAVYFYRRDIKHPLAHMVWLASVVTVGIFLVAVYFILNAN